MSCGVGESVMLVRRSPPVIEFCDEYWRECLTLGTRDSGGDALRRSRRAFLYEVRNAVLVMYFYSDYFVIENNNNNNNNNS
jgi:hypothetical protein